MRESAGADDCWTHDVLSDWPEIIAGNVKFLREVSGDNGTRARARSTSIMPRLGRHRCITSPVDARQVDVSCPFATPSFTEASFHMGQRTTESEQV